MDRKGRIVIIVSAIIIGLIRPSFAGTTIDTTGAVDISGTGVMQLIEDIQNIQDETGPAMASALWLSSVGGYPVGQANLGGFGHFFIGVSLSMGMANLKYYDGNYNAPQGYYPAYGPDLVLIAGLGLSSRWDVLAKFMTISDTIYKPSVKLSTVGIDSYSLYSFGGRIRYQAVSRKVIFPGLLSFGGIAVCVGGDFFSGSLGLNGESTMGMGTVDISGFGQLPIDVNAVYDLKTKWYIASGTADVRAYLDIFWIFSLYTGLGFSAGYGTFEVDANGVGTAIDTSYTYSPTGEIGMITAVSKNLYYIRYYLPVYIIGMELNLWLIRLSVESMVDLGNRSDINVQFAARFQY